MHHASARLTVYQRELLCHRVLELGWSIKGAAEMAGVSRQTASKWLHRYREEGKGLANRSTRPNSTPTRVGAQVEETIRRARLALRAGPHRLSWIFGRARSTIYAVLRRLGLNRLRRLEPKPLVIRYEWPRPEDLVHLDTKKLGRIGPGGGKHFQGPVARTKHPGIGVSVVHVAVDDHSRLAYVEELPDEGPVTTTAFTARALLFFAEHGIVVKRILTDNGNPYRSFAFRALLDQRGIVAKRTRPYTPRTNGKAEAMIKILLNGWAYARPYTSSTERSEALPSFLDFYNLRRPHGGLNGARPIDRVRQ